MKNNPLIYVMALGLVAIVGTGIGFGINAALGSDDSTPVSTEPAQARVTTPQPEPTEAQGLSADVTIEPDPDYERALRSAGISRRGWQTDFSRHTVPYDEILSGGVPRDGIPPLDDPRFATLEDADRWLADQEPVIAFELNGDARAYPLQILVWHEIVNDVVGGVPVAVTFCPLCNTAIVFERTLKGVVYDFGTSGKLRNSDLVMWDRQTESWWQQFTGEAIVGELAGKKLAVLPASIISFSDFRAASPDGTVLSIDTGFSRSYGRNPYGGYDRADNPPFLFDGDLDGRLAPKDRVVDVSIDGLTAVFPFPTLEVERVVNYTVNNQDLVVFFKSGTVSALDKSSIKGSRDVGATGVFERTVDSQNLTFRFDGENFVDHETGSIWNILGQAVEGPLSGQQLKPVFHTNIFWFAIAAFRPDAMIYQGIL